MHAVRTPQDPRDFIAKNSIALTLHNAFIVESLSLSYYPF